jgi:hypothetical protein
MSKRTGREKQGRNALEKCCWKQKKCHCQPHQSDGERGLMRGAVAFVVDGFLGYFVESWSNRLAFFVVVLGQK